MKEISNFKQAVLRTLFIFISMPAVTWAGIKIDDKIQIDYELGAGVLFLLMAAFVGGVSSVFVKTSFDENMKYPNLAKIWIGTFLGTFSGLIALENLNFGLFSIALPTFIIATLGAPIMVFYLMWLSDAETQLELKNKIKDFAKERGIIK